MTPDRKRRDLFLTLIDALLEQLKRDLRMDIRDRIAAMALVDRVLARDKSDDTERAGSKVRAYSGSFTAARVAANEAHRAAADPRQGATSAPQDAPEDERDNDDDEGDDRVSSAR
jgi:hypothetical protein